MSEDKLPIVIVTGSAGNIGTALVKALKEKYLVIGLDQSETTFANDSFTLDLTSQKSVRETLARLKSKHGEDIASVVHLAAYFDFTGEDSPKYQAVNVDGTEHLLNALRGFNVERFIYSSTMLAHKAGEPGSRITEETPLDPDWAYPKYKLKTEQVIQEKAGDMPYTLLRLAGVYDERSAIPILVHQIARIYEKNFKSHLYPGNPSAGQAYIHKEDMTDAILRTVERRQQLPKRNILLLGENRSVSYEDLQDRIGELIHGKEQWQTLWIPKTVAKAGAWLQTKAEPVIPDSLDKGEKPFIRPFMIDMASDHYELDTSKAERLLGWRPTHFIYDGLEPLIENLKKDPAGWYKTNGMTPPS